MKKFLLPTELLFLLFSCTEKTEIPKMPVAKLSTAYYIDTYLDYTFVLAQYVFQKDVVKIDSMYSYPVPVRS